MELLHNTMQVAYAAFLQQKKVLLPDNYSEEAKRFGVYVGTDELHLIAIGKHDAVLAAKSAGYWAARMAYDTYTEYYKMMLEEAVCQIAVALGNNKIEVINEIYQAAMEEILGFEKKKINMDQREKEIDEALHKIRVSNLMLKKSLFEGDTYRKERWLTSYDYKLAKAFAYAQEKKIYGLVMLNILTGMYVEMCAKDDISETQVEEVFVGKKILAVTIDYAKMIIKESNK